MSTVHVALIQSDIVFGDPEANYAAFGEKMKEAVAQKADFIILPEMWTTAYDLKRIQEIGDLEGERTKEFLQTFARENNVTIVGGSIAQIKDGKVYNTTFAVSNKGEIVAEYSKIHLFRIMREDKYLTGGEELASFPYENTKVGITICYDIRFPELARSYALDGAGILVNSAEWPHPRLNHWRTLMQARAIENQMFVIACNRVGISGKTEFFGHSMVIDPWGEILVEGGEEEGILFADIDLNLIEEVRGKIPVFADRRPDLYE
jgi:omega-amidase